MTFISAVLLGLLASLHCAGMCGGLQSVLQQPLVIRSRAETNRHLLALNFGRLSIYLLAGLLVSSFGSGLLSWLDVPRLTQIARYLSAGLLVVIGLQLLLSTQRPFAWLERAGAVLWRKIQPNLNILTSSRLPASYQRGLVWGFLPCGLVYSVLLTTLFAESAIQGGLIMLGFGIGTLPALLLTGNLYMQFRQATQHRSVRAAGGLLFIQGGVLTVAAPYLVSTGFVQAYPQLMSNLFCLS
ncbi:MAG: sulfite exporter TauE/SafE family protein [Pseudomonadota bacterium]